MKTEIPESLISEAVKDRGLRLIAEKIFEKERIND